MYFFTTVCALWTAWTLLHLQNPLTKSLKCLVSKQPWWTSPCWERSWLCKGLGWVCQAYGCEPLFLDCCWDLLVCFMALDCKSWWQKWPISFTVFLFSPWNKSGDAQKAVSPAEIFHASSHGSLFWKIWAKSVHPFVSFGKVGERRGTFMSIVRKKKQLFLIPTSWKGVCLRTWKYQLPFMLEISIVVLMLIFSVALHCGHIQLRSQRLWVDLIWKHSTLLAVIGDFTGLWLAVVRFNASPYPGQAISLHWLRYGHGFYMYFEHVLDAVWIHELGLCRISSFRAAKLGNFVFSFVFALLLQKKASCTYTWIEKTAEQQEFK